MARPTEAHVLDGPDTTSDVTLVERYGHLLPDSLIRSTIDTAPGTDQAQSDVAALADAARRAPVAGQP